MRLHEFGGCPGPVTGVNPTVTAGTWHHAESHARTYCTPPFTRTKEHRDEYISCGKQCSVFANGPNKRTVREQFMNRACS